MRLIRALLGFLFGVLVAWCWLVPARAETIPATGSGAGSPVAAVNWKGYSYSGCNPGQCLTCQYAGEYLLSRSSGFSQCRDIGGGLWSADFVNHGEQCARVSDVSGGIGKGYGVELLREYGILV